MTMYQHIVVGLDLAEECSVILKKASAIAHMNNTKLSVVHVVEPLAFAYGGDVPIDLTEAQDLLEQQAKKRLQKIVDETQVVADKCAILVGNTPAELHRFAEDNSADLIIVGSHGRHGLALLFGSTANGVLHGAKCDVLAIRV